MVVTLEIFCLVTVLYITLPYYLIVCRGLYHHTINPQRAGLLS
jgi:hypothetical protein